MNLNYKIIEVRATSSFQDQHRYQALDPLLNACPDLMVCETDLIEWKSGINVPKQFYVVGTNAYSLFMAIKYTRGQLVPRFIRDAMNIPTISGITQGLRFENYYRVSAHSVLQSEKQNKPAFYARRTTDSYYLLKCFDASYVRIEMDKLSRPSLTEKDIYLLSKNPDRIKNLLDLRNIGSSKFHDTLNYYNFKRLLELAEKDREFLLLISKVPVILFGDPGYSKAEYDTASSDAPANQWLMERFNVRRVLAPLDHLGMISSWIAASADRMIEIDAFKFTSDVR